MIQPKKDGTSKSNYLPLTKHVLHIVINYIILFISHRDLGEIIRRKISEGFPQGETSQVDATKWTKFAQHFENIAADKSLKQYPRSLKSTASGLSVEDCRGIVSTDFLNLLKENKKD